MKNYKTLIKQETKILSSLHKKIHESFINRKHDPKKWELACSEFHSYISKIDPIIDQIYSESVYADKDLQEFVITFLELDPMFFRSGYVKEEILRKIKKTPITTKQEERLRNVLMLAVEKRGTREYRGYCRLSAKIANSTFIEYLVSTSKNSKGSKQSRARLMLEYINN